MPSVKPMPHLLRGFAKWAGITGCVLCALAFAASVFWEVSWVRVTPRVSRYERLWLERRTVACLAAGSMAVWRRDDPDGMASQQGVRSGWSVCQQRGPWLGWIQYSTDP